MKYVFFEGDEVGDLCLDKKVEYHQIMKLSFKILSYPAMIGGQVS
jgi:hypothetical protein